VIEVEQLSPTVRLLRLENRGMPHDDRKLFFIPGQFVIAGDIGFGEAPFSMLSSPYQKKFIELAVRKAGIVTGHLFSLQKGDTVTLRGPYGNGFPIDFMKDRDIVMASGGCGIPPIISLAEYIIENRKRFGNIFLLYGAKTPDELLMKDRLERLQRHDVSILTTIDEPFPGWNGHVGFVTDLIEKITINEANSVAVVCGPGPMFKAFEKTVKPFGISDRRIFISMERKMQCGVGKCQHCTTGSKYVCTDGPVFTYDQIRNNWD